MGFNKKVLSKAVSELGKAKAPAKPRDIITDPAGQWKYPGQKTRIPGSSITMQGVNYPVWAQPNVGPGAMMQPNQDYEFPNADYVDETPMAKKGGTLKSKKYSKNISATNKLFTKNKLFKNMKSKIFDPNSKFKSGGSKLGPINLNPNPLSHYELNYGFNLPTKQKGGLHSNPWLYTYNQEDEEGNPAQVIGTGANFQHKSGLHGDANVELPFFNRNAEGMSTQSLGFKKNYKGFTGDVTLNNESYPGSKINPSIKTSVGYNKNLGDHIGFGIEATNNSVQGKPWNPNLQASMTYNFQDGGENDEDDDYEEHDLTDEQIQELIDAGHRVEEVSEYEIGGYVQHELVKAQVGLTKKPLKISDPDEYAFRKGAYDDSSTMHRLYDNDYNAVKKFKTINEINNYRNSQIKSKGKQENAASMRLGNPNPEKVETHTNLDGEYTTTTYKKPVQPVQFVPNIKSTSNKGVWSGGSKEQYPTGINTSDWERKTREYQEKQRGTKQPVAQVYKNGGTITEVWEDELDEHSIRLLRKAGYIVEELD
jgi:hypothetical protein